MAEPFTLDLPDGRPYGDGRVMWIIDPPVDPYGDGYVGCPVLDEGQP